MFENVLLQYLAYPVMKGMKSRSKSQHSEEYQSQKSSDLDLGPLSRSDCELLDAAVPVGHVHVVVDGVVGVGAGPADLVEDGVDVGAGGGGDGGRGPVLGVEVGLAVAVRGQVAVAPEVVVLGVVPAE
jgi:hypothetical protein